MAKDNVIPLFNGENIPEDLETLSSIAPKSMSLPWLKKAMAAAEAFLAVLDEREPADMDSEEYDLWATDHEEVEDFIDELREQLDKR